jgi:penicillin-binding protein 1C
MPLVSPSKKCEHAKMLLVDSHAQVSYCTACLPKGNVKQALYPNYTPELISFFEVYHIPYQKLPPHYANCPITAEGIAPKITSLSQWEVYLLPDEHTQLPLYCMAAPDAEMLYWYVNGRFLRAALPYEQIFFDPPLGKVSISCVDARGRKSTVYINVN